MKSGWNGGWLCMTSEHSFLSWALYNIYSCNVDLGSNTPAFGQLFTSLDARITLLVFNILWGSLSSLQRSNFFLDYEINFWDNLGGTAPCFSSISLHKCQQHPVFCSPCASRPKTYYVACMVWYGMVYEWIKSVNYYFMLIPEARLYTAVVSLRMV